MDRVTVDEIDPEAVESHAEVRRLTAPLGTTDIAINRYLAEPGERFIGGIHAHADQEEVFIVVKGKATFETLDGEIDVGDGEVIRFGRGEFQSGKNTSGNDVVVYALGAPRGTDDVRVPLPCPECSHDALRPTVDDDSERAVLVCPNCGARSPVECPSCGGDNKRVVLGNDGETLVDVCLDCDTRSQVP